jgi:prepilin-type N-terminal cleavage/methylation domain-containing protein
MKFRAFTLIELLVVIAIIGVLSSVVLASLNSARGKARDARRASDMSNVVTALELYFDQNGTYPPDGYPATDAGCGNIPQCLTSVATNYLVASGFLGAAPADPSEGGTTHNYRYCVWNSNRSYMMIRWNEKSGSWCRPQVPVDISTAPCGGSANYWRSVYPAC